jgi:hypothetical protein
MTQTYDFSVRGGGEKSTYYASLGHFDQDGVNIGVDFKRTTAKLNYRFFCSAKWTVGRQLLFWESRRGYNFSKANF